MATLNIRMDDNIKKKFEMFCSDTGMSMTTAINIFATTVVKEQRIPFEISNDPFYSAENMAVLKQSLANIKADKGVYKTFEELEAMENG